MRIRRSFFAAVLISAASMASAIAANFLPAGVDPGGFSRQGLDRVTAMLEAEVAQGTIPGAILLIQHHGKPVYYQGFGLRDPQTRMPMTQDAIFRLYSMTKPVTSVAAMMLVEDGRCRSRTPSTNSSRPLPTSR